jgi:hypothetical protein
VADKDQPPAAAAKRVFDLRSARDAERGLRIFRWFGAILGAVLLVIGVAGLARILKTPTGAANAFLAGSTATCFGFFVLGVIFVFAFAPGAESIEFGARSIVLRYSGERTKEIDLSRHGTRVKLYVYPPTWASGRPRPPPRQVLFRVFPLRNPLTQEAYDYLLTWAMAEGLKVQDRPWSLDGPNPSHTVLLFGAQP